MAGLMYEGSELPESVKKAVANEMNYRNAIKNKIPLANEGSAVPDSVRKAAQNALEGRGRWASLPNTSIEPAVAEAAEAGAKGAGKGLLSRAGSAIFGPIGVGLQAMTNSEGVGEGSELTPEQREAINPGMTEGNARDAAKYAQHIQDMAKIPPTGKGLLMNPNAAVPREEARVDPVAKAHETEKERQQIEEVTTKKLQSNQLSRTKAAEAVVQADCTRKGIDPAPEVKKKMVAEEVNSMRSLDTNELGKYLSYALMGLGVFAGSTSAANADRFTGNFQNAYQNTVNRALKEKQMAAAAAQQQVENEQKNRELDRQDKDVDSKVEDRSASQDLANKRYGLDEDKAAVDKDYKNARLGQYDQGINLEADRNKLGWAKLENDKAYRDAKLKIADKAAKGSTKGAAVTSKDAQTLVTAALKSEKMDVDEKTLPVIAETYRQYQAANPGADPSVILKNVLKSYATKKTDKVEDTSWVGSPDYEYGLQPGLLFEKKKEEK